MNSRRVAKISLALAIAMLVVSVAGFITTSVVNAFFLDKYNAYGEVPVPGSGSIHLPAGEVTVSLHTVVIGGTNGTGLPVPPLGISIDPPEGVPQPRLTESMGSTTTVNNDAHVRVWIVQVPAEGTYRVTTEGQVGGYINPRLAFGHQSSYGYLVWVFVAVFVVGLADLALSVMWLSRSRPKVVSPAGWSVPVEPSDEGVKLERLKTIAALRDSGALTESEFESEKRRILEGH
ncbi:SHOCT domain-containing protein [Mycobacterium pseudokansasii]|uniref:SHOCT domain-containing protein n=1 Tax=Mycobacterium pseudokansasii TaxID=2341080 RepID=A0A498QV80_9MYCO|nr:SHOCT domain-containing protein [Mycobacterium pseudokansasii]VBA52328.1 hypothetical protein LAUMK142_03502 [Mycobacterium pseudokansasii]